MVQRKESDKLRMPQPDDIKHQKHKDSSSRRRIDRNFDKERFMDRPEYARKSLPNYVKPTTNSAARKERSSPVSVRFPNNSAKIVAKNPGGTESGKSSVVRVCGYSYCSLNTDKYPLKSFLQAKRSTVQTQKAMKIKGVSPFRKECRRKDPKEDIDTGQSSNCMTSAGMEDSDLFSEIHEKTHQEITTGDYESSRDDHPRKSGLSDEELDNIVNSLEYVEFDHEVDEGREYDESGYINGESKFSTDLSEYPNNKTYCSESLDSDSLVSNTFEPESSLIADEIVENSSDMTEEDDPLSNKIDILVVPYEVHVRDQSLQTPEEHDLLEENKFGEIRLSPKSMQVTNNAISVSNLHIGRSEDEHGSSEVEGNSKAKWNTKRIQRTEATEDNREFNPRPPRFLPLEPDPEAEKVDLRHQMMDERRNSEEWMVDYALQQTVTRLAPARNKNVELLVEAFETIMPSEYNHSKALQSCS